MSRDRIKHLSASDKLDTNDKYGMDDLPYNTTKGIARTHVRSEQPHERTVASISRGYQNTCSNLV